MSGDQVYQCEIAEQFPANIPKLQCYTVATDDRACNMYTQRYRLSFEPSFELLSDKPGALLSSVFSKSGSSGS